MVALHANYLSGNERKANALAKYSLWLSTQDSEVRLTCVDICASPLPLLVFTLFFLSIASRLTIFFFVLVSFNNFLFFLVSDDTFFSYFVQPLHLSSVLFCYMLLLWKGSWAGTCGPLSPPNATLIMGSEGDPPRPPPPAVSG